MNLIKSFSEANFNYFITGTNSYTSNTNSKPSDAKHVVEEFSKMIEKSPYEKKRSTAKIIGYVKE